MPMSRGKISDTPVPVAISAAGSGSAHTGPLSKGPRSGATKRGGGQGGKSKTQTGAGVRGSSKPKGTVGGR